MPKKIEIIITFKMVISHWTQDKDSVVGSSNKFLDGQYRHYASEFYRNQQEKQKHPTGNSRTPGMCHLFQNIHTSPPSYCHFDGPNSSWILGSASWYGTAISYSTLLQYLFLMLDNLSILLCWAVQYVLSPKMMFCNEGRNESWRILMKHLMSHS